LAHFYNYFKTISLAFSSKFSLFTNGTQETLTCRSSFPDDPTGCGKSLKFVYLFKYTTKYIPANENRVEKIKKSSF